MTECVNNAIQLSQVATGNDVTSKRKWWARSTYEIVNHGLVEGSDVEVEHSVDVGPLLGIVGVQRVVLAEFAHQVAHNHPAVTFQSLLNAWFIVTDPLLRG